MIYVYKKYFLDKEIISRFSLLSLIPVIVYCPAFLRH